MRSFFMFFLVILPLALLSAQDDEESTTKPSRFELSGNLGIGYLIGGERYNLISKSVLPSPQEIRDTSIGSEIRLFFSDTLGLEVGGSLGVTSIYHLTTGTLAVLTKSTLFAGPRVRWNVPVSWSSIFSVYAGGGINDSWASYTTSYRDLFPGNILLDLEPKIGYYGKAGVQFTPGKPFFIGAELVYEHLGGEVAVTHRDYSGDYLQFKAVAGMWF